MMIDIETHRLKSILEAAKDARYLLSRNYSFESVVNFVTTRYMLSSIERNILIRLLSGYNVRFKKLKVLRAKTLVIDGYNVLITTSVLLKRGLLVKSVDGLLRDVESKHGKNISLENMKAAVDFLEKFVFDYLNFKGNVLILLERNISKSGELAKYINSQTSLEARLQKTVDLELIRLGRERGFTVSTSDSLVISKLGKVFPLTNFMLRLRKPRILLTMKRAYLFD